MSVDIDTTNKFAVSASVDGARLMILLPPLGQISPADALNLAGWLVAIADPAGQKFAETLEAVRNA